MGRGKQANETCIAEAVNSVKSGLKIRHAAETYGVPYSTLRNRLRGTLPIHQAKISSQLLSPKQEEALVNIILQEEQAGRALNRYKLQAFTQRILDAGGGAVSVGRHWVNRFLSRHTKLRIKGSKSLEANKAKSTTKEAIRSFFTRFTALVKEKKVLPKNIANINKHSLQKGALTTRKVVGDVIIRKA